MIFELSNQDQEFCPNQIRAGGQNQDLADDKDGYLSQSRFAYR